MRQISCACAHGHPVAPGGGGSVAQPSSTCWVTGDCGNSEGPQRRLASSRCPAFLPPCPTCIDPHWRLTSQTQRRGLSKPRSQNLLRPRCVRSWRPCSPRSQVTHGRPAPRASETASSGSGRGRAGTKSNDRAFFVSAERQRSMTVSLPAHGPGGRDHPGRPDQQPGWATRGADGCLAASLARRPGAGPWCSPARVRCSFGGADIQWSLGTSQWPGKSPIGRKWLDAGEARPASVIAAQRNGVHWRRAGAAGLPSLPHCGAGRQIGFRRKSVSAS